ncbi:MAG: GNAT family N-acetyltransferase [Pseudomonadales bacterium]
MPDPRYDVTIVDYAPRHQAAFAALNYAWIEQYFSIEAADRESLDHPQEKILQPGGAILMAELHSEAVGTCALIRISDSELELAKMAVSEAHRGARIGLLLGQAAIERARHLGASQLWLESNTILTPALSLYRKLGFQAEPQQPSDYARSNIQMRLQL